MTRIVKVVRDIQNLQDFYKRTKALRSRIKKKGFERLKVEQVDSDDENSHAADQRQYMAT